MPQKTTDIKTYGGGQQQQKPRRAECQMHGPILAFWRLGYAIIVHKKKRWLQAGKDETADSVLDDGGGVANGVERGGVCKLRSV
jgi:hypothetical protein